MLMNENFDLLLADFGFVASAKGKLMDGKGTGTPGYQAPEQIWDTEYCGRQSDLFATAVSLFMMVTQCQPFEEATCSDDYYRLLAGNRES